MSISISRAWILTILAVLSLLSIQPTTTKQVNSFNILLPTSYHPTKGHARQIIITSGGCYQWQSTDSTVIKVQGTHHGLIPSESAIKNSQCNSNGIVELVKEGLYTSSVYVTARDRASQELISVPVRVRDLRRISIFTKSRIMNVREIQNLEIFGFDAENNTFTSLEGLRFKWIISDLEDKYSSGVLQKIPLSEANLYLPSDTRKKLENEEKVQSDLLVIKALRVGKVRVKVRCLEPNYELVSDQITLYIQQKFQVSQQSPIHVLTGSTYQLSLLTLSGQPIPLPSPTYTIHPSNPSFTITKSLQITSPLQPQSTTLKISDIRTEPSFTKQIQIFAEKPDFIEILVPQQVVIGEEVLYQIRYYCGKRLLKGVLGDGLVRVEVREEEGGNGDRVFGVDRINQKIKAIGKGSAVINVQFNGVKAQKRISSTTPLKLLSPKPHKILLPISQTYQLSIIGGSGLYKYTIPKPQQQSILTLSYTGLLTTRKEGTTEILVTDQKNLNNRLEVRVSVVRIGRIYGLEGMKEFNVLEEGSMYIGAMPRGDGSQYYTECNDALLRGLSFQPASTSQQPPLQLLNTNPINYQTLSQLHRQVPTNRPLSKTLQHRSSIPKQDLLLQYEPYLKHNQIKKIDLQRLLDDMENYGLCAKVLVKPVQVYDGDVFVRRVGAGEDMYQGGTVKLRVYGRMESQVQGLGKDGGEVVLTPMASFRWKVKGGPYRWNEAGMGDVQVYINNIKMDSTNPQNYLHPVITCPNTQKSDTTYTLKYRNPVTEHLLRPVQQQKRITVHCKLPDLFRLGLPYKSSHGSKTSYTTYAGDDHTLNYFLSGEQNSTLYILPGQCFRISCQPVIEDGGQVGFFYNATNVKYEFQNIKYGKLQQIQLSANPTQPRTWNTRVFTYSQTKRPESEIAKDDIITLVSRQVLNPKTLQHVRYPRQISHTIQIKTIQPIKVLPIPGMPQIIDLPNIPNTELTLKLDGIEDSNRFSIRCNQNILKCTKTSSNELTISPKNIDRTTTTNITIIDEYTIGNPQISIPIKVKQISGVDIWVTRTNVLDKIKNKEKINKEKLSRNARIFDGDQFVVLVDVYTAAEGVVGRNGGNGGKESLGKYNLGIVDVGLEKNGVYQVREIMRGFDQTNGLLYVLYKMPRIYTSKDQQVQSPQILKIKASVKHRINELLTSNVASVQVFNTISLQGSSIAALPYEELQIRDGKKVLTKQIDSFTYIMQSCSNILTIQGGPPNLKTKITSNPSQPQYFTIHKLSQRSYKIETVKTTFPKSTSTSSPKPNLSTIKIQGKQQNLIIISVYVQDNVDGHERDRDQGMGEDIGVIRCLVIVAPIRNVRIVGNQWLLSDRQVRYRVEFGEVQEEDGLKMVKQECSLKYQWSVVQNAQKPVLQITSDTEKLGVNVTSIQITQTDDINKLTNPSADLSVSVLNKKGRQITKSTKKISLLIEQKPQILPSPNPHSPKNPQLNINSNELVLIPPHSSLKLSKNILIEETVDCRDQDSCVVVRGDNQIVSGGVMSNPELFRLGYKGKEGRDGKDGYFMPTFVTVLVAEICTAVVANVDGGITITPGTEADNMQIVQFEFMDCYGRKFLHYNFKNIQYRVTVTDPNIATAKIPNPDLGQILLQGHQIGTTQLILQIFHNNHLKAKDILPLSVNIFIQPSRPLSVHIGDIINFKAPTSGTGTGAGAGGDQRWTSSDSGIVKVNPRTGEAVAYAQGEVYVRFGGMGVRVGVVRVVDFVRRENQDGYQYQIVYSGKKYPDNPQDTSFITPHLTYKCQILGEQSKHLTSTPKLLKTSSKDHLQCLINKIPGTPTPQKPIKSLKIAVSAENHNIGFYVSRQFQENLRSFVILSQRYVQVRDGRYRGEKVYVGVVQTGERLDVGQRGGKDQWILSSEFNGARQLISVDLSHYKSGQFLLTLTNPRTKHADHITISNTPQPSTSSTTSTITSTGTTTVQSQSSKQSWRWTDILVIFMAVNFLLILGYQVWQSSNNTGHLKVY